MLQLYELDDGRKHDIAKEDFDSYHSGRLAAVGSFLGR